MRRNRCSLCGGKLKKHICIECGLDNRKCDKDYKKYHVNENSCDGEPLTHIHMDEYDMDERYNVSYIKPESEPEKRMESWVEKPKYDSMQKTVMKAMEKVQEMATDMNQADSWTKKDDTSARQKDKKAKRSSRRIIKFIVTLIIIFNIIPAAYSTISNLIKNEFDFNQQTGFNYEEPDYSNVTYEIPETGENYDDYLYAGNYEVGVQIPEGIYNISYDGGEGSISIYDDLNSISTYTSFYDTDKESEMKNVRLYQGAKIQIGSGLSLEFKSKNAQESKMIGIENPNKETIVLEKNSVAGKDFPAGIYDISIGYEDNPDNKSKYTVVELFVPGHTNKGSDGEEYATWSAFMSSSANEEERNLQDVQNNIPFPEGTKVTSGDEEFVSVTLTPSEKIKDTDYELGTGTN